MKRHSVEPHAGLNRASELGVASPDRWCGGRPESPVTVATGTFAEPLAEGSAEDFVALESAGKGDVEDRFAAGQQHHGCLTEA